MDKIITNVTIEFDCKNDLGEGPVWDHLNGNLMWVDYNRGKICNFQPQSKKYKEVQVADTVMVSIPTNRNKWILAVDKKIAIYDPEKGKYCSEVIIRENDSDKRLNDGKCDGRGRLWIGTMRYEADLPSGALYRVDADLTYKKMDEHFVIPNGMAWNKNNTKMYIVDSSMKKIFCYDFDLDRGSIYNKKTWVDTSAEKGMPDGMTIDENDNLWVSFWKGQSVCCFDGKTGAVLTRICIPAMIPSSCCFGGDDLATLFITSSRKYDTAENKQKFPFSGALFSVCPGVRGMPASFFNET